MHKVVVLVVGLFTCFCSVAQKGTFSIINLNDLSAFKPQAGNWQVVQSVIMDRNTNIHQEKQDVVVNDKKKPKNTAPVLLPVTFTQGQGILLNINNEQKKDHLITVFEHGDIELELEVMLPKGSNSGIYLQGRYELQLFDSWGVKNPKFSDMGGIYRNWEKDPATIYMGKAPSANASKAPGLWQSLKISFRAPKFDVNGKKTQNAKFLTVHLNGILIQQDVEVPQPTGGPIEKNEKALGPIMIQGDHGPVAFRNIKYKQTRETEATVSKINYKIYHGIFKSIADFTSLKPVITDSSDKLSCEVLDIENEYGIEYTGNVTVTEDANYTFTLMSSGTNRVIINNREPDITVKPDGYWDYKVETFLKAGTYPFKILNFKTAAWVPTRLSFRISTENSYPKNLNAYGSFPMEGGVISPIYVKADNEPKLLRGFFDFKADKSKRLSHTIGVGDPTGINYVYDLKSGNLVAGWRGDFIDATPMWYNRGNGSFTSSGATTYLFLSQPLAFLTNQQDTFPTFTDYPDYKPKGYVINETTGRPVFKYMYKGIAVEDKIIPDDENRILTRELTLKEKGTQAGLYFKLAEGTNIVKLSDGSFAVNDFQYYIKPLDGALPEIRENKGKQELVQKVDGTKINYSVIW